MKALKWTQFPRPALIIILRKGFSEEEREKISLVREYWSNLVILYLGFVNISFRCYQAVPMMIALYQALLPSLVLFFFFFFSCLLFFFCLFWVFISFFFFPFTIQTYLFFTILKGDVCYKSAQVSQNGIKVEWTHKKI